MREERKQDTERHEDENKEGDRKSQSPLEFTIQKIHQKGVRKGKLRHLRKKKKESYYSQCFHGGNQGRKGHN